METAAPASAPVLYFQVKPERALHFPRDPSNGRTEVWADSGKFIRVDHPLLVEWLRPQMHKVRQIKAIPEDRKPVRLTSRVVLAAMDAWDKENEGREVDPRADDSNPMTPLTRPPTDGIAPGLQDPRPTPAELQDALSEADTLRRELVDARTENSRLRAELTKYHRGEELVEAGAKKREVQESAQADAPSPPPAPPPAPPAPPAS